MISKILDRAGLGLVPRFGSAVCLTLGAILGACDADSPTANDDQPDPTTGTLAVDIVTTGVDLGEGYVLVLDGQARDIETTATVAWIELAPGLHTLELQDLDYNCRVSDQPQGSITVVAGQTTIARFTVECRVKEIVFVSTRDGNYEAYWSSVTGEGEARFMSLPTSAEDELVWSPDGQFIAGATDLSGDFEIFIVDRSGANMINLTKNPGVLEGMPTWSPDGSQIAYRRYDGNDDLWVMNADGSGQKPLVATPARERLPQWSPDGQSIAFVSDDQGNDDIWVLHIASNTYTRLTDDEASDEWPSWSPTGEQLAFATRRDGNTEIYVMNKDGSEKINLSQAPGSNEWLPAWSPDGKYITFDTDRDGNLDIYWMKSDGTRVQPVTTSGAHDFFATWNPNPWAN